MSSWVWPMKRVKPHAPARYRVWLGQCPHEPLASAPDKPLEARLYLKQWGKDAQEPYSFCLELMKYIAMPGKTPTAYKGLQHYQIAEADWDSFFGDCSWWPVVSAKIREFQAAAPPIEQELELIA